MKQTAVNWLIHILKGQQDKPFTYDEWMIALEHAQAMEKEQMDKVAGDWWNEGASYMHDGGRKYKNFEQYYNETFKSE